MSESAPESTGGGGGNVFTRKLGPLPMWAWMGIVLVAVFVYSLYRKNQASNATTTAAAAANAPGGVDASLVPQFINQTYVNPEPPAAPNISNSYDVNSNNTAPATTVIGNTGNTAVNSPTTTTTTVAPPKPPPPPPSGHGQQYTTVTVAKWTANNTPWNSTLSGIANHYKVPGGYQALAKLNKIPNPNLIYPGQKIKVPVSLWPT